MTLTFGTRLGRCGMVASTPDSRERVTGAEEPEGPVR